MNLHEFLKKTAGLRDEHDLASVIRGGNDVMQAEIERLTKMLRQRELALGVMTSLSKCDTGGGFGGDTYERWFFVAAYAHDTASRPTLTRLECVVVPDAISEQFRHRPVPHPDPTKVAQGIVTMTPTHTTAKEIADEAVARYASDLRAGTYDDVLTEPCGFCGEAAVVYCEHYFDTSNEHQVISVSRLCVRCLRVADIASVSCDYYESPPFLPPVKLPQRYR